MIFLSFTWNSVDNKYYVRLHSSPLVFSAPILRLGSRIRAGRVPSLLCGGGCWELWSKGLQSLSWRKTQNKRSTQTHSEAEDELFSTGQKDHWYAGFQASGQWSLLTTAKQIRTYVAEASLQEESLLLKQNVIVSKQRYYNSVSVSEVI